MNKLVFQARLWRRRYDLTISIKVKVFLQVADGTGFFYLISFPS